MSILFQISIYLPSSENEVSGSCSKGDGVACDVMDASESVEGIEVVTMSEDVMFLEPVLIILAILHVNISFLILVAYYKLKVSFRASNFFRIFHAFLKLKTFAKHRHIFHLEIILVAAYFKESSTFDTLQK